MEGNSDIIGKMLHFVSRMTSICSYILSDKLFPENISSEKKKKISCSMKGKKLVFLFMVTTKKNIFYICLSLLEYFITGILCGRKQQMHVREGRCSDVKRGKSRFQVFKIGALFRKTTPYSTTKV